MKQSAERVYPCVVLWVRWFDSGVPVMDLEGKQISRRNRRDAGRKVAPLSRARTFFADDPPCPYRWSGPNAMYNRTEIHGRPNRAFPTLTPTLGTETGSETVLVPYCKKRTTPQHTGTRRSVRRSSHATHGTPARTGVKRKPVQNEKIWQGVGSIPHMAARPQGSRGVGRTEHYALSYTGRRRGPCRPARRRTPDGHPTERRRKDDGDTPEARAG